MASHDLPLDTTDRLTQPRHLTEAEDTLEGHLLELSRKSMATYLTVVAILLAAIAALPVLRVSVSVQAEGIIRPQVERHEIRSRASGLVEWVGLRNDAPVRAGDELVRLRSSLQDSQRGLLKSRIIESEALLADLEELLADSSGTPALRGMANRLRHDHERHLQEQERLESELRHARLEAARAEALVARGLLPRSELESLRLSVRRLAADQRVLDRRYRASLAEAQSSEERRHRDLIQELERLEEQEALLTVAAPVEGSLEQVASLAPGSYLRAGDLIATVSPEAALFAEVYVDPRHVGLLRTGQQVRLLIDSFDYSDWGFVPGRLGTVSEDYVLIDQRPMFRAVVHLESTTLELPNGFRGELRKGMTLRARFILAERTLWQLLRDDLTAWLDPVRHTP